MNFLAQLDHRHLWHPFTQMTEWLQREPVVIVSGRGAILRDVRGRRYLDANASIWTNLHGHNHPAMNRALERQLGKIAHSSALGLANEPAARLGEKLVQAAKLPRRAGPGRQPDLTKIFYSDDGSTALEVALKLAHQFALRTRRRRIPHFLSLDSAYHGDTLGAVALGQIDRFREPYSGLVFKSDKVAAPFCYRCPHNRAKPERRDAREYRRCGFECLETLDMAFERRKRKSGETYAAFVVEPLIQGAAGMIAQPDGWLRQAAAIARSHNAQIIADEVMTGFGRTGVERGINSSVRGPGLFACHKESVQPDFLALAKGMTGGYLPMAATLMTQEIFRAFLGKPAKAFFHGHSFTGNQLGSAAALQSLELLQKPGAIRSRGELEETLRSALETLWEIPFVGDIRQVGLVAGVELVRDWRTRKPFASGERIGFQVCEAMRRRGVLTRPIGDVIVIMPPYCTTPTQVWRIVRALGEAVLDLKLRR